MTMNDYRVSYVNMLDGKRHVLIGRVDKGTAKRIAAQWSDPNTPGFYMGNGVRVERDDGTPDGKVITE